MLDVRKPIAYLFFIVGALLILYGILDPQITSLETVSGAPQVLKMNLDLTCGISMFVFAAIMFVLIRIDEQRLKGQTAKGSPAVCTGEKGKG